MSQIIFGGIEGGASVSSLSLINGEGQCLAECSGLGTNCWTVGEGEAIDRVGNLIKEAKSAADLPENQKITCMCLSLSGCEEESVNNHLKQRLQTTFPDLCENYVVCSDTVGPIAAAHPNGGVVIIAGTGSNALLINPDGKQIKCGGWGHMLGDEGGAFWIAQKALKIHYDAVEKLEPPPHRYSTDAIWETTKEFFNVKTRDDMLEHLYSKFSKSKFSRLCKELSVRAHEGDPLCRWVFEQAGTQLAKHLIAVSHQADKSLLEADGGLPVVCVGSVWKSWDLMKPGFVRQLLKSPLEEVSLKKLTTSAATGAVYVAAKASNFDIPRDYSQNSTVFYHYVRGENYIRDW